MVTKWNYYGWKQSNPEIFDEFIQGEWNMTFMGKINEVVNEIKNSDAEAEIGIYTNESVFNKIITGLPFNKTSLGITHFNGMYPISLDNKITEDKVILHQRGNNNSYEITIDYISETFI